VSGKIYPSFSEAVADVQDGATILLAGQNFGCGSSREHAPWALLDFGIRCVIAPDFADIFHNNCFKNGILPVRLPRAVCDQLIADARMGANARLTVDLEEQVVVRPNGDEIRFEVDQFRRHLLLNGLDAGAGLALLVVAVTVLFRYSPRRRQPGLSWLAVGAGVTVLAAIASILTGALVREDLAMTGEITLRGKVLAIGGLKEKVLAAHRAGLRRVLMPARNEADLDDIPAELRKEMKFVMIESIDQVLREALTPRPHAAASNGARNGSGARPTAVVRAAGSSRARQAPPSRRAAKGRRRPGA